MKTLNIFCDASITISDTLKETVGCPGIICMTYDEEGWPYELYEGWDIIRNTTNNESEISAILLGVQKAVELKDQFTTINLFSDSRICIQGLKNWIFTWVNNVGPDNMLYGSNNRQVANQYIITRIVRTIIDNNLNINLWHQKGHVNVKVQSHINEARALFESENHLRDVPEDFIKMISHFNNRIDYDTKVVLKEVVPTLECIDVNCKYKRPMRFDLNERDMGNYRNLVNVQV